MKCKPSLQAFHQGTLTTTGAICPRCNVDLAPQHLVWECSYWQQKGKCIPTEWQQRLQAGTDPVAYWARGLVQQCVPLVPWRDMAGRGGP